jgi:hypothetical protein
MMAVAEWASANFHDRETPIATWLPDYDNVVFVCLFGASGQ